MREVVQKVIESKVEVAGKVVGEINEGLNVLVGFTNEDTEKDIDYLVNKITNLRIFDDENGVMNKSVKDIHGEILCISQFTLYGDAKKGNRPSYIEALTGELAKPMYNNFCQKLCTIVPTYQGIFGADMKVFILNNGPTTIIIDTKK